MASSNKRIRETSIDRLSALPDSIIIHILSLLEVKHSAVTSVLSKRLQFLWRESPRLIFREKYRSLPGTIQDFVNRVHRTLVICGRNGFKTFEVEFYYNPIHSVDVDVWVDLSVRNKVKNISLLLNASPASSDFYTLPEMIFQNSYLEQLTLRRCILAPRRTVEWGSLTELRIGRVELKPHVIEKILAGCPVLRYLSLIYCWGFNCLEVDSKSLHRLGVYDRESGANHDEPCLRISAPYLRSLLVSLYYKGRKLVLGNVSSLGIANIGFIGSGLDIDTEEVMENARDLLEKIRHVKVVNTRGGFSEVISSMVVNGYRLPQSPRTCLSVKAPVKMRSVHGIVGLLDSSPNLEALVIEGVKSDEEPNSCPDLNGDLDRDLLHLKTITIKDFICPNLGGEPLLTLARILLKKAPMLKKMVVNIEGTAGLALMEPYKIAQTLLSYPRSSIKAVIVLK